MKYHTMKRKIASFLALLLCVMMPLQVMAQESEITEPLPLGSELIEYAEEGNNLTEPEENTEETQNGQTEETGDEITEETGGETSNETSDETSDETSGETSEDAEETAEETEPEAGLAMAAEIPNLTGDPVASPSHVKLATGSTWYRGFATPSEILTVKFSVSAYPNQDELPYVWNADSEDTGKIIGYYTAESEFREVVILAKTESAVYANEDSSEMFKDFTDLTDLQGMAVFNTSMTEDMTSMFEGCESLSVLDLSMMDTGAVTDGDDFAKDMKNLVKIKLGTGWTGICELFPPSSEITDGYWYDFLSGERYDDPSDIPVGKSGTYVANLLYSVSYDMQGHGQPIPDDMYVKGSFIRRPADPMEEDWFFMGWYKDQYFLEAWDFDKDVMGAKDMVLFAKWEVPNQQLDRGSAWYRASASVATISQVRFDLNYAADGTEDECWKADGSENGGLMGYRKGQEVIVTPFYKGTPIIAAENASEMFKGFSNLDSVIGLENIDFTNTKWMARFFSGCEKLTEVDCTKFGTASPSDLSMFFYDCKSLTSLDLSGLDTGNATDMSYMFRGCTGLTSIDVSCMDTANVTTLANIFAECATLSQINFGSAGSFHTEKCTNMEGMFRGCRSLTSVDLGAFSSTASVLYMDRMFQDCEKLKSIDLSNLDTMSVVNMSNMFAACAGLTSLDVSGFDTANVVDMSTMFTGCIGLSTLDLSTFNTANVKNMGGMFYGCTELVSLDISGFSTGAVKAGKKFTEGTGKLAFIHLGTGWTSGKVELSQPNTDISDGYWYSSDGLKRYLPSEIPSGKEDTYSRKIVAYAVTYDMKGHGEAEPTEYFEPGKLIRKPEDPSETGWKFVCWCKDAECNTAWNYESDLMPAKEMTLYAKWTPCLSTVQFNGNTHTGGEMAKIENVRYGTTYTLPKVQFVKTGHTFVKWNTRKDAQGTDYADQAEYKNLTPVDGDKTTFYAQWRPNVYTIRFDKNEGGRGTVTGTMADMTGCEYTFHYKLTVNDYHLEGYKFLSWNSQPDGKGITYQNAQTISNLTTEDGGTVVLYAVWETLPVTSVGGDPAQNNNSGNNSGNSGSSGTSGSSGSSGFSGSSGSGSLSGSSGGGAAGPAAALSKAAPANLPAYVTTEGTWKNTSGEWMYEKKSGETVKNAWECIYNPYVTDSKQRNYDWFMFDENGKMRTGWYTDKDGHVYYLNPASDGTRGKMVTGWYQIDGVWYYFSEAEGSGTMGALVPGAKRNG